LLFILIFAAVLLATTAPSDEVGKEFVHDELFGYGALAMQCANEMNTTERTQIQIRLQFPAIF
jgi:hypothetical protein